MDRKDDRELLRKGGFAEQEVLRLHKLRQDRADKEKYQVQAANRRLEFARWLFTRGKISEQIA